jgi:hypothetical protein
MVFKLIILPLAELEIEEAIVFYESKKKGLGKYFFDYLKGYLKIIKNNPELFALKKLPYYRELSLKKFPFSIIYEVFENDVIVHSIFHNHRSPLKKP